MLKAGKDTNLFGNNKINYSYPPYVETDITKMASLFAKILTTAPAALPVSKSANQNAEVPIKGKRRKCYICGGRGHVATECPVQDSCETTPPQSLKIKSEESGETSTKQKWVFQPNNSEESPANEGVPKQN